MWGRGVLQPIKLTTAIKEENGGIKLARLINKKKMHPCSEQMKTGKSVRNIYTCGRKNQSIHTQNISKTKGSNIESITLYENRLSQKRN